MITDQDRPYIRSLDWSRPGGGFFRSGSRMLAMGELDWVKDDIRLSLHVTPKSIDSRITNLADLCEVAPEFDCRWYNRRKLEQRKVISADRLTRFEAATVVFDGWIETEDFPLSTFIAYWRFAENDAEATLLGFSIYPISGVTPLKIHFERGVFSLSEP